MADGTGRAPSRVDARARTREGILDWQKGAAMPAGYQDLRRLAQMATRERSKPTTIRCQHGDKHLYNAAREASKKTATTMVCSGHETDDKEDGTKRTGP